MVIDAKYTDKHFTAATQLGAPAKMRRAIISQPGYRRGEQMVIQRTLRGEHRLYVWISGQWMDGSLQDKTY